MTRDRADNHRNISFRWPIVFWIGMVAVSVTLIVLLREVLLPFVTGMVLAYLLNPLAQRIERRGLNRLVATLLILAVVVIAVTVLLMLLVPVIVRELAYFIESGQSLEDYVLSPYLVGRRVHLNAVWTIFALFAFGYLFEFVGLLIAVPLAAAIGVLTRFALRQYYESPLSSRPRIEPRANVRSA